MDNKSKSGRVRKKPKKFADFESEDEVPPPVNQIQRQKIRKGKKKVSYLNLESSFKILRGKAIFFYVESF